jgi:fumarate reductase flavoprotein subunit
MAAGTSGSPNGGRTAPDATPQQLEDLVAAYNAAIVAGTLHLLSPPRRSDRYRAWPIRTAPFFAMPICAAITNTMGGIVVDRNGAVLDRNDTPVPGLFAAGSTVGRLCGAQRAGLAPMMW